MGFNKVKLDVSEFEAFLSWLKPKLPLNSEGKPTIVGVDLMPFRDEYQKERHAHG